MEEVRPSHIDLIYWDSRVAAHEEYTQSDMDTLIHSTKPKGGGGTDPTCMETYLKEQKIEPECIIMLTDGEIGSWGSDWGAPILWAISNDYRKITAPVGLTLRIED